jgi:hypothetical protein
MIKNKHKWGNNISNRNKIMVNSPEDAFWYNMIVARSGVQK